MQTVAKDDIRVVKARGRRTTAWVAFCTCGWQGRVLSKKEASVQEGLQHGANVHDRNARVIAPAAEARMPRRSRR